MEDPVTPDLGGWSLVGDLVSRRSLVGLIPTLVVLVVYTVFALRTLDQRLDALKEELERIRVDAKLSDAQRDGKINEATKVAEHVKREMESQDDHLDRIRNDLRDLWSLVRDRRPSSGEISTSGAGQLNGLLGTQADQEQKIAHLSDSVASLARKHEAIAKRDHGSPEEVRAVRARLDDIESSVRGMQQQLAVLREKMEERAAAPAAAGQSPRRQAVGNSAGPTTFSRARPRTDIPPLRIAPTPELRAERTVWLRVWVSSSGDVQRVGVAPSEEEGALSARLLGQVEDHIRKFVAFEPGTSDGVAVDEYCEIAVRIRPN